MATLGWVGLFAAVIGGVALAAGVRAGRTAGGAAAYLEEMMGDQPAKAGRPWDAPITDRIVRPVRERAVALAGQLTPKPHLDRIHTTLLRAGLANKVRAEEVIAVNTVTFTTSVGLAILLMARLDLPARLSLAILLLMGLAGAVLPQVWLERNAEQRTNAIRRALPDVLDLMAISVEAGVSLDAAMMVATEHLDNPLALELGLVLTEMELGLPRRQALQNLRRRVDISEVTGVVVALLQADELGMPIGHVLRRQGAEMRAKRRMRAREAAGKLPVKIVFPLVFFIFPPIMVILLGPTIGPLMDALG